MPEATEMNGKKRGGRLNGPRYVDQILKGPLKWILDTVEEQEGRKVLAVEDGAPCHRSTEAKNIWHELGIRNLEHPPSSPDLDPIEPLWLYLKNQVADIPGSQNSTDALWAVLQQFWDKLTIREVRKHTNRMQDRVDEVSKAKGWHTSF